MGTTGSKIKSYNAAIFEHFLFAAGNQLEEERVIVVDHHTGFSPKKYLADELHPNAAGDRHIAGRWFSVLQTLVPARHAELQRPVRVMPFGDSITQKCYRWDLFLLMSTFLPNATFDFVGTVSSLPTEYSSIEASPALLASFDGDHSGYSGLKTAELAHGYAFRDANFTKPDVVLFMTGTNDFKHTLGIGDSDVDQTVGHLQFGIDEMLRASSNATIVVAQIIPTDPQLWIILCVTIIPSALTLCIGAVVLVRYRKWRRKKRAALENR